MSKKKANKDLTLAALKAKYPDLEYNESTTKEELLDLIRQDEELDAMLNEEDEESPADMKARIRKEVLAELKKEDAGKKAKIRKEVLDELKKEDADKKAKAADQKSASDLAAQEHEKEAIKAAQSQGNWEFREGEERPAVNDFVPQRNERGLYHIELDKRIFAAEGGKRLTKAFKVSYTSADYRNFLDHGSNTGYKSRVLWDPTLYVKTLNK